VGERMFTSMTVDCSLWRLLGGGRSVSRPLRVAAAELQFLVWLKQSTLSPLNSILAAAASKLMKAQTEILGPTSTLSLTNIYLQQFSSFGHRHQLVIGI
jgi:hypothetical protein